MKNGEIKAVIFDLGRVLIDFDHRIAAKRIAKFTEKPPEEIFDLFFDSKITSLFERGKISPEDFFLQVKEMLGLKLGYPAFVRIWNEIFFLSSKNEQVCSLAAKLKGRYKLAVLSNVNSLHMKYILRKFPIFGAFDHLITSYEVGFQKPHPKIYQAALSRLKIQPSQAFYTDDRAELIEQSRALGIQGFVFKNISQLKKDLQASGIKTGHP